MDLYTQSVISLTQNLIQMHPFFGHQGLEQAQKLIYEVIQKQGWSDIHFDRFGAKDINQDPQYVNVSSFGEPYLNYESVPKINVIGIAHSKLPGPTLILNAHVDVDIVNENSVWYEPYGWMKGDIIDNKLYGRGACDMLGGLSSVLLTSSRFIQQEKWGGRIIFCSVCDEEIGGNGTLRSLHLLKKLNLIDEASLCIIAEPTENQPCQESLGFMHIKLEFKSNPQHMGCATRQNNAIYNATACIENFVEILCYSLNILGYKNALNKFRVNFGKISGGIDPAIPIGQIIIEGTIFYPEDTDMNAIYDLLSTKLQATYNAIISREEFTFPGAKFLINKSVMPIPQKFGLFPSPCDARLYKTYNIPTLIWGPGSLQQAHGINEYIEIEQISQYCQQLYVFLYHYMAKTFT